MAILTGLIFIKFWNKSMQESFWHRFGQNPLSRHWDIVIFMLCAIFSNGKQRPSWNAKLQKNKETFWHKVGSISTYGSWDIVIFVFMLFLVTAPGGHLGLSICRNLKYVHYKIKWLHTRNILAQSWINFNQWFLRYCHFCAYDIFSNGPWRPS